VDLCSWNHDLSSCQGIGLTMSTRRKHYKRDPYPYGRYTKAQLARILPFKLPIIEQLVFNRRKLGSLVKVLSVLALRVKPTPDGKWFDIVRAN
jgi:hypothetical protein